jgi:hypothetical protein
MKLTALAKQLKIDLPVLSDKAAAKLAREANKTARAYGTTWATEVVFAPIDKPAVTLYDGYHAESRTGIRASMAALKRFWSTYHYVPMRCQVTLPLISF